jgi:hypothetical protein
MRVLFTSEDSLPRRTGGFKMELASVFDFSPRRFRSKIVPLAGARGATLPPGKQNRDEARRS